MSSPTTSGRTTPPHPMPPDVRVRASEHGLLLAAVVRGLALGVVTAGTDGRIVFASPAFAAMLGYPDGSALSGVDIFELTHPDDRRTDVALAAQVLSGEREGYTLEKRFLRRDGSPLWVAISATLVRGPGGEPEFAFGIVQDISERKAAEESAASALTVATERGRMLDAIMAYVPEGITIADAPDVTVRMVSAYGTALTGRPLGELADIPAEVHPDAWGIFHRDGVTRALPEELPLTRSTRGGAVVKDEEWVIRRPDGTATTILCNSGPIRDDTGKVVGGIIAWRDIDDRKRSAEERERLLAAERDARGAAEAASRARGDFLASMSHELRTPLNAILGYQDLLESGVGGALTEVQRRFVDRTLASARHLLSLVNQVLSFSRVDAGAVEYQIDDVAVADLFRAAEPLVAPQAKSRDLTLLVHGCAPELCARADAEKAMQVVLNLLSNAVKFTPPHGLIDVRAERADGRVLIHVRDTGPGIAQDELEAIFEPFRQSEHLVHGRPEGTGLGLSISRAFAEGMGGQLTVESSPGQGSTFTLVLPAAG